MSGETGLGVDRDAYRARLLKYTRKAWEMLPPLTGPRILDIGCGSGLPTIELARWSRGTAMGLDVDQAALERLMARAKEEGLEDRVAVGICSLFEIDLPDEGFDIVWAEGAMRDIGFERALREWRRLLRHGGYLVVHDDAAGLEGKLATVEAQGYELVGHFLLPDDAWWVEYYRPMEEDVQEMREHASDRRNMASLEAAQAEIDRCKASPGEFRSVFIVMRRA